MENIRIENNITKTYGVFDISSPLPKDSYKEYILKWTMNPKSLKKRIDEYTVEDLSKIMQKTGYEGLSFGAYSYYLFHEHYIFVYNISILDAISISNSFGNWGFTFGIFKDGIGEEIKYYHPAPKKKYRVQEKKIINLDEIAKYYSLEYGLDYKLFYLDSIVHMDLTIEESYINTTFMSRALKRRKEKERLDDVLFKCRNKS